MSEELGGVLSATREVAAGQIAADASRIDRERLFPSENLRLLGEAGALGLLVPSDHGVAGGG